jgi:3-methylfumaryl-CoA hydratase
MPPSASTPDMSGIEDWIGRSISIEDEITLPAVRRIAAMLDLDPAAFKQGSPLPPHWYLMFFTNNARRSELGHDGHPAKGDFQPPFPLPRRMAAGRRVRFPGLLHVGDHAAKRSEIASIVPKQGRSGPMVFVTVRHVISVGDDPAVVDEQDLVYREATPRSASPGAAAPSAAAPAEPPARADWSTSVVIDPVLSFRFSAVTWNGHRIHYDPDYARQQEGYPGCVVNGALTIHLLIDAALDNSPGRLVGLAARMVRPMFVGNRITLAGSKAQDGHIEAWAADDAGALACSLQLEVSK